MVRGSNCCEKKLIWSFGWKVRSEVTALLSDALTIPQQDDRIVFDYTELSEDLTYMTLCVGREKCRATA
jgi:hypothetical protein